MALADYIEEVPEGIYYIKILSQMAAINSSVLNPTNPSKLSFRNDSDFRDLLLRAVSHLPPDEAQRRMFLIVSITFHSIADICRAAATGTETSILRDQGAMFEQVVSAIESLILAPSRT